MKKMQAIGAPFTIEHSSCSDLKPKEFDWTPDDHPIKVFIDGAIASGISYQKKLGDKIKIKISYSFCVSEFLEKKLESQEIKYVNLKKINDKHNIKIFYGNRTDYFEKIFEWIYSQID